MNVLIKDFNGFNTSIEIEANDIVGQIKEKIQKYLNIPKESQTLIFQNIICEDNKKAEEYNIYEGSTLNLMLKENFIKINAVNIMGKTMPFYLKKCDTIKTIKMKIEEREGIPQKIQKLLLAPFNKKQILEDSKTIEEYNIKQDDRIHILYNNIN